MTNYDFFEPQKRSQKITIIDFYLTQVQNLNFAWKNL